MVSLMRGPDSVSSQERNCMGPRDAAADSRASDSTQGLSPAMFHQSGISSTISLLSVIPHQYGVAMTFMLNDVHVKT